MSMYRFFDRLLGRKKKESGEMKPPPSEPASMPQGGAATPPEPKPMGEGEPPPSGGQSS